MEPLPERRDQFVQVKHPVERAWDVRTFLEGNIDAVHKLHDVMKSSLATSSGLITNALCTQLSTSKLALKLANECHVYVAVSGWRGKTSFINQLLGVSETAPGFIHHPDGSGKRYEGSNITYYAYDDTPSFAVCPRANTVTTMIEYFDGGIGAKDVIGMYNITSGVKAECPIVVLLDKANYADEMLRVAKEYEEFESPTCVFFKGPFPGLSGARGRRLVLCELPYVSASTPEDAVFDAWVLTPPMKQDTLFADAISPFAILYGSVHGFTWVKQTEVGEEGGRLRISKCRADLIKLNVNTSHVYTRDTSGVVMPMWDAVAHAASCSQLNTLLEYKPGTLPSSVDVEAIACRWAMMREVKMMHLAHRNVLGALEMMHMMCSGTRHASAQGMIREWRDRERPHCIKTPIYQALLDMCNRVCDSKRRPAMIQLTPRQRMAASEFEIRRAISMHLAGAITARIQEDKATARMGAVEQREWGYAKLVGMENTMNVVLLSGCGTASTFGEALTRFEDGVRARQIDADREGLVAGSVTNHVATLALRDAYDLMMQLLGRDLDAILASTLNAYAFIPDLSAAQETYIDVAHRLKVLRSKALKILTPSSDISSATVGEHRPTEIFCPSYSTLCSKVPDPRSACFDNDRKVFVIEQVASRMSAKSCSVPTKDIQHSGSLIRVLCGSDGTGFISSMSKAARVVISTLHKEWIDFVHTQHCTFPLWIFTDAAGTLSPMCANMLGKKRQPGDCYVTFVAHVVFADATDELATRRDQVTTYSYLDRVVVVELIVPPRVREASSGVWIAALALDAAKATMRNLDISMFAVMSPTASRARVVNTFSGKTHQCTPEVGVTAFLKSYMRAEHIAIECAKKLYSALSGALIGRLSSLDLNLEGNGTTFMLCERAISQLSLPLEVVGHHISAFEVAALHNFIMAEMTGATPPWLGEHVKSRSLTELSWLSVVSRMKQTTESLLVAGAFVGSADALTTEINAHGLSYIVPHFSAPADTVLLSCYSSINTPSDFFRKSVTAAAAAAEGPPPMPAVTQPSIPFDAAITGMMRKFANDSDSGVSDFAKCIEVGFN